MSKQRHLSRLAAPKSWPIKRKGIKWIAKPRPGAHSEQTAMPIGTILTEILNITEDRKDAKRILHEKQVFVNGRVQKDIRLPVGLLDVISIPIIKKNWRVLLTGSRKLSFVEISDKEANTVLLKVRNKTILPKKKVQLNLTNGWNILVAKDTYSTDGVLVYDTKTNKIADYFKLEKGVSVYFLRGKHAGANAKLVELKKIGKLKKENIAVVEANGNKWETITNNLIIVGKVKPIINLGDVNGRGK